jgi:hypothetical protein
MSNEIKVKLTVDLSRYDGRLSGGQEGVVTRGAYSRLGDRFAPVRFDCGASLDVLWQGLKIIDEAYLAERQAAQVVRDAALATAVDVVWTVGPRGGFRHISYRTKDGSTANGDRTEAQRIRTIIETHGIRVREVVER